MTMAPCTTPLDALQQRLEQLYDVRLDHRVEDFVITDPVLARELEDNPDARPTAEKLLVRQHADGLDLALYLDAALLERLETIGPHGEPDIDELADYCTVLEGVSHFLYLGWNAGHGREVTPLELELQAEVDKYIVSARRLRRHNRHAPAELHRWLFANAVFAEELERPELERYRDASRYAGSYCRQLAERYLGLAATDNEGLLRDLRRFYRLPLHHKLRHIGRVH